MKMVMKHKLYWGSLFFFFLISLEACGQPVIQSTVEDQTSVEVSVYQNNLGLVKERRNINLSAGEGELTFTDVASSLIPASLHVTSLKSPGNFEVLEQSYNNNLISPSKLLDQYVGRKIKIIDSKEFQDRKDVIEAVLLSNDEGPVYQIDGEIYLGHAGVTVLPDIPENFRMEPAITWLYHSEAGQSQEIEVSYLVRQIHWQADYILVLNGEDTAADLTGWVTLENESGMNYKNAAFKLVAGDVHLSEPAAPEKYQLEFRHAALAEAPSFKQEELFEYHLYDLKRKTTLLNNQSKQINWIQAEKIPVKKEYAVHGRQHFFTGYLPKPEAVQPVEVSIKLINSAESRLGMPLPAGRVRFYKKDSQQAMQFVGEDRLPHTARDEEATLKLGRAFDIAAERIQKDFKEITARQYESEWEITLRNHKKEDVTIGLFEPLYGHWQVLSHSHPFTKKDATTLRFDIPVPKDGEVKVNYRVRVGL